METGNEVVEAQVGEWLAYMHHRRELSRADAAELEDHLRSRMADLVDAGLEPDEAFLVAVKRMGALDELTREFAREHSDRLWKQLVLTGEPDEVPADRRGLTVMIACAVVGALVLQVFRLAGLSLDEDHGFYVRNAGLFALAPLAAYLLFQRRSGNLVTGAVVVLLGVGAIGANAFGLATDGMAAILTAIHLPVALWLVCGVAYADGDWRSSRRRMDFIRFTGEWFVYYVLIALGGGVLTALTLGTFHAIDVDASEFVTTWLLPCGAIGAVVVAAWLVEAKQSVIENIAPVLTWVFTPLFLATLVAFFAGAALSGNGLDIDRDVLILFDLVLVVVVGLLLYGISARDSDRDPTWFDAIQLGLVLTALAVDALVLAALVGRITDFGFTANKTAALGENLILLANLAGSAWVLLGFVRGRTTFARLERWQTGFLLLYAGWAAAIVLVFPLVFGAD